MDKDIKKILEIAINAPSGSNSQPWRFEVKGNKVYVIALPEKDHPVLNYHNRGTWIAHGALIENIIIVSSSLGYYAKVEIFPNPNQTNLTAIIELVMGLSKSDPLFCTVPLRTTNRKKYKDIFLTESQKKELFEPLLLHFKGIKIKFIEDKDERNIIGESLSVNEILTLENEKLHKLFFKEIIWSSKKEFQRTTGFPVKTMELKPPQKIMLKFLRNWQVMKLFNNINFARLIANDNAKIYSSGAGIVAIIISNKDEDFLLAGRVMERIWLKATQIGLSVHPITGILYFWQAIQNNMIDFFSQEHIEMVNNAYEKIKKIFNVNENIIALTLRIGPSADPSAYSLKNSPEIIWL